jgi:hypothetical protein
MQDPNELETLFFDPIKLRDARVLRPLREAGEFIQSLPKVTQDRPEWQEQSERCCRSSNAMAIRCWCASVS